MTTGRERMERAQQHERAVARRLRDLGWFVQLWGQGTWHPKIRNAVKQSRTPVLWRWTPDLIAYRDVDVVLVDAKADQRDDTENFSIETKALETYAIMERLGLPVFVVWQDMTCNRAADLRLVYGQPNYQRGLNGGSGTPFALVRKHEQHELEWAFGYPAETAPEPIPDVPPVEMPPVIDQPTLGAFRRGHRTDPAA